MSDRSAATLCVGTPGGAAGQGRRAPGVNHKPRASQSGIPFGNAPYSGDPAAIRPMPPAVSPVRASGDGKPRYFDQTPLESKDMVTSRQRGRA
jgi:hypothetical protein